LQPKAKLLHELLLLSAFVKPAYFSRDYSSRLGRVLHRSSKEPLEIRNARVCAGRMPFLSPN